MKQHFEGELGVNRIYNSFDYDDEEFMISGDGCNYMFYIGDEEKDIELPKGCTCCDYMFLEHSFENKDILKNFDTTGVTSMNSMFNSCSFPEDFSLGDKFNFSDVKDVTEMFAASSFSKGFSFGTNANFEKIQRATKMFSECYFEEGFTFDKTFDTSGMLDMSYMFMSCRFSEGFSFGSAFTTVNTIGMIEMFKYVKFPKGFTLGNNFNTENVKHMDSMFAMCEFGSDFSLGKKFTLDNVESTDGMFMETNLPKGISDKSDKEIVQYLQGSNNCKVELLNQLKQGKSFDECRNALSGNYDINVVNSTIKEISNTLLQRCSKELNSLFKTQDGASLYTVGEVRKKLINSGYPEDIVNKGIVNYLENQYIED